MAAVEPSASFPMDKKAAEEEIAQMVRKPGFTSLTIVDIIRHMNNRFNLDFAAYKKQLKQMVMTELSKADDDGANESSSSSDSEDDEPPQRAPKKEVKEEVRRVKEEPAANADDSDSDSGVEDATPTKGKKKAAKVQNDMLSNIKSSGRRAAASNAMKQIRNTSEGGRFAGRKKKEKDPNADNSGKFGPMTKLCYISPELQQVTKDQWMKRCDVVKVLWEYINENDLKDPKNKQFIICDDILQSIFKRKKVKAFGMVKFLTGHIIGLNDMRDDMRAEAEEEMDKRREEWKERQKLRAQEEREGSSKSEEPEEPAAKKMKKEEVSDDDEEDDKTVNNKDEGVVDDKIVKKEVEDDEDSSSSSSSGSSSSSDSD
ncbi:hypothetical protein CAEBREN_00740 [Caenorhabditis brenneri]|uniref:DM2 domain-containing protein n=1 Tax=Caenorhabditis brenneri TaxID=135651 RepID=G0MPQ4_CAEBE|nr:hypothetical protein CAEBREN_00740 [Caenorhabditis brenneri]